MVRELREKVYCSGLELSGDDKSLDLSHLLIGDDTALLADTEVEFHRIMTEFGRHCDRGKLQVNVG